MLSICRIMRLMKREEDEVEEGKREEECVVLA